ncbi:MAG: hypothetical protein JXR83_01200 [Deltaproteobacteria bacterium]|nr:hypothetical protein [Deltaproteobacteria bacterium]
MADEQQSYLVLASGRILTNTSEPPPGLYLVGKFRDGLFAPEGAILGDGAFGDAGQPGWMEISDGSFHGDQTSRPPFPPYVRGYMTKGGEFRPLSRRVNY